MRRPEPTKRQLQKVIKVSQFKMRMEFVLDFDHPVSIETGRETARRMLEQLKAVSTVDVPEGFGEASLRCIELRRLVRIQLETPS